MFQKQIRKQSEKCISSESELLPEKYRFGIQRRNAFSITHVKIVTTISIFILEFKFVNYKTI